MGRARERCRGACCECGASVVFVLFVLFRLFSPSPIAPSEGRGGCLGNEKRMHQSDGRFLFGLFRYVSSPFCLFISLSHHLLGWHVENKKQMHRGDGRMWGNFVFVLGGQAEAGEGCVLMFCNIVFFVLFVCLVLTIHSVCCIVINVAIAQPSAWIGCLLPMQPSCFISFRFCSNLATTVAL